MYDRTVARWLTILLIPFIILMLLHASIPMVFLLETISKAEEVYNQYKLTSQQTSLQSKGILSAQIVKNRLQSYENMRQSEIDTFLQNENQYVNLNYSAIQLNFAGDPTLQTASKQNLMKSMWFTDNVAGQKDLSLIQLQQLNKFKNVQKFIEASLVQNDSRHLPQFQIVVNNPKMYFAYPSFYDIKFQNNSYNIFDAHYLEIKNHYYETGQEYLIFKQGTSFKLCNILLTKSYEDKGTFCFIINSVHLATQLKQVTKTSMNISSIDFYFMKPYNYFNEIQSEVIFKFNNNQNSQINYTNNYFIQIQDTIRQYFNPTYSYKFFFKQYSASAEYIIAPVKIKDIHKDSVLGYFLIVHYYKPTDLTPISNFINTILIIFLPAIVLIIFFSLLMIISMRILWSHLQIGICQLNQHCRYILEGDLKINVPQYDDTKDLRKIYAHYRILNEIFKISSQKFYEGSAQQVLLKYLQVLKLFKELKYDTSSLSQIIGNCYYNNHDHENATIYYKNSIDENWKELQQNYNLSIAEMVSNFTNICKQSSSFKDNIKLLKRKYFKLTLAILFPVVKQEDRPYIQKHFQCFRKISMGKDRLTSINLNMISAEIRYFHATMQIENANIKLTQFEYLAKRYVAFKKKKQQQEEDKFKINPYIQIQLTPEMYIDIGKLMKGVSKLLVGQLPSAARLIIDSMEYCNRFRPIIANMKIDVLMSIFKAYNCLTPQILSTIYFKDHFKRDDRQVIMIFQWTREKNSSIQRAKLWKKMAVDRAKQIFTTLQDNDRLSLIKFDIEPQTLGTLTKVKTCRRLLAHTLDQLKKIKLAKVKANVKSALKQTIQRTKLLRQNKYLMFFIRDDTYISREEIESIISGLNKYKIIFIQFGRQLKGQKSHKYFLLQAQDKDTFDRIFSHKEQIKFFNMVNPF